MARTGKYLLWDLGNTLITTDTLCFAKETGFVDFMLYPLLEWKNPKKIYQIAFDLLETIKVPHHEHDPCHATASGRPLPPIMCRWLSGTADHHEIMKEIEQPLREWTARGAFNSNRQARLVDKTLKIIFNPKALARCVRLIDDGVNILKECSEQVGEDGKPLHTLFIFSNWDPYSFKNVVSSLQLQDLFHYFKPDHIIISGNIGTLKPEEAMYSYVINKYQLNPNECILIDDQLENIKGAEKQGITGLLLKERNYKQLRDQLKKLQII